MTITIKQLQSIADSGGNVVSYTQLGGTTQDVCVLLA